MARYGLVLSGELLPEMFVFLGAEMTSSASATESGRSMQIEVVSWKSTSTP